ncbi:hypothetical protein GCM10009716_06630 [Streptomyces sodiiphilus]|uniref:Serine kinase n=1 Tax=Streptomyces sodiiphilus TaxID=226217 RepID=A0ABN2NSQ0_9ACTN
MTPASKREITIAVQGATVAVASPHTEVTDWVASYFGPWWPAARGDTVAFTVVAREEPVRYEAVTVAVTQSGFEETGYPRVPTRYARYGDGTVYAVAPEDRIAYRWSPGRRRMTVYGSKTLVDPLARATARVSRELIRAQLIDQGWCLLHASAAVLPGGQAVLVLGNRGAGKTTTAFCLTTVGAELLANDRVFARPAPDGDGVELLAWPSGAAVGLGLMNALGWTRIAARRLAQGMVPHTSQDGEVTAALHGEWTDPVLGGDGRELKAHLRPEEFAWYGVRTVATGRVATALFPRVEAGATPHLVEGGPPPDVEPGHFMTGSQEDSYPDVFGLTGGRGAGQPGARAALCTALASMPRRRLVLGHDIGANAAFVAGLLP